MSVKATVTAVKGATLEFGTVTSDNLASIAAGAEGSATVTITGADTTDLVFVTGRALLAGLVICEATVTTANTVVVKVLNTTGGALDDGTLELDYMLVKVA